MDVNKLNQPDTIPFEAEICGFLVHGLFDRNKIKGRHFIGDDSDMFIRMCILLSECLVSWDLTIDSKPYPIEVQSIAELPLHITNGIFEGINNANKGKPPKCMT